MRPVHEMIQLIPFKNFFDIKLESFAFDVAILAFNVLLTIPLGFFLRFLFKLSFGKVLLAGFLISLLYEVTQLTGLFFIYPRPYRIFDVDDLIINTLGAFVGYSIVPMLSHILPSPFGSEYNLVQGSEVAFPQRCAAVIIDVSLVAVISVSMILCCPPVRSLFSLAGSLWRFPLFYILFLAIAVAYTMLFGDKTLGIRMLHLRLMAKGGKGASRLLCSLRFATICTSMIALPFWIYFFMTVNREYTGLKSVIWVFCGAVLMMFAAAVLLEMMFNAVTHGASMFYDRFFKTYLAYGSNRKFSMFGIRVIDIQPLSANNVDLFSNEICEVLSAMSIPSISITQVRLMTEGIMLDWIENGLGGILCELRLDKRYKRKMLMLSVSGDNKTNEAMIGSYATMLSELNLTIKTYYAAEKNICNILIP